MSSTYIMRYSAMSYVDHGAVNAKQKNSVSWTISLLHWVEINSDEL